MKETVQEAEVPHRLAFKNSISSCFKSRNLKENTEKPE